MNNFLALTKNSIQRHGKVMQYIAITEGQYNIETGSVSNIETQYSVTMHEKHIKANQYNYPNLIGKDSSMFYLANYKLAFVPAVNDKIMVNSLAYSIDSIIKYHIDGDVVLYKLIAVRG